MTLLHSGRCVAARVLVGAAAALCLTSAAFAQVSHDVVRIGVLTDMNGNLASLSGKGSVVAAQMAAEDFGGKVLGKPIEIVSADHQNKPDIGSQIASKWFDIDNVDMIVDAPNSSVALAVQGIAKQRSRVFIASAGGTAELTGKSCSPTGIQWTWDTYAAAVSTAKAIVGEGGKIVVLPHCRLCVRPRDGSGRVTRRAGLRSARSPVRCDIRPIPRISRRSCCRRSRPAPM